MQEKAIKMVAGLKGTTYLEKCAELGLETLEKRRADQDLALVYKFVTKKDRQTLFNQQSGARTRQAAGGHGTPGPTQGSIHLQCGLLSPGTSCQKV